MFTRIVVVGLCLAAVVSGFVLPSSSSRSKAQCTSYAQTSTNRVVVVPSYHQEGIPSANSIQQRPSIFTSSSQLGASADSSTAEATSTSSTAKQSSTSPPSDWEEQILSALSIIIDPDLNADIVTLGFIKNLQIDSSSIISLDLELTTPACPVKDEFVNQCQDIINGLDWTRGADITLTAQPTPTPETAAPGTPLGMSQIGSVIAVSSCKGGVGKSTTSVNLAYALSKLGAKVGIFDADVYGPSLPTMVTPTDDNVQFIGRQIAPLTRDNVKLMSFGYVNEGSAVMRGPMVTQLLDQFLSLTNWGALDYLILDMPPGTGDIQLTLSQRLNITAAVIVTTPQELSFVDVERGVEMFDTVNVPCVAVVENMAYFEKEKEEVNIDEALLKEKFKKVLDKEGMVDDGDEAIIDDLVKIVQDNVQGKTTDTSNEEIRIFGPGHKRRLSEQWGIEHSYSIPLLSQIAQNGDSGTPFILDNPDSPQADIYFQLAKSVVSEVAKTKYGLGKNGGGRPNIVYNSDIHIIEVTEAGQEEDTISTANLRRACRCAECVEELSGKQILDPKSVSESIKPISMSPTGNYALSVDWSDGHRSLYPYRQIRSLIEDAKEGNVKEEAML